MSCCLKMTIKNAASSGSGLIVRVRTRFDTEAKGNWEMAHSGIPVFIAHAKF